MGYKEKFEDFLDKMQGLLDNAKKQGHILVRVEDLERTFPELRVGLNLSSKKLNCKSLMIGDWVYRPDCFDQVKEIRQNGIIGLDSARGLIPFLELEPIPLTPEILEKNGFHEEWDDDITLMVCDTITIEIGNNYKLYKDGKMYLRRVLAPLYYVHELQHALRLCGIEKEIEL